MTTFQTPKQYMEQEKHCKNHRKSNPFQMCGRKIVKTHARKNVRRVVFVVFVVVVVVAVVTVLDSQTAIVSRTITVITFTLLLSNHIPHLIFGTLLNRLPPCSTLSGCHCGGLPGTTGPSQRYCVVSLLLKLGKMRWGELSKI